MSNLGKVASIKHPHFLLSLWNALAESYPRESNHLLGMVMEPKKKPMLRRWFDTPIISWEYDDWKLYPMDAYREMKRTGFFIGSLLVSLPKFLPTLDRKFLPRQRNRTMGSKSTRNSGTWKRTDLGIETNREAVGWIIGWLVGSLVGWLVGSLVGWLVGWLVGSLVHWLVGYRRLVTFGVLCVCGFL